MVQNDWHVEIGFLVYLSAFADKDEEGNSRRCGTLFYAIGLPSS